METFSTIATHNPTYDKDSATMMENDDAPRFKVKHEKPTNYKTWNASAQDKSSSSEK